MKTASTSHVREGKSRWASMSCLVLLCSGAFFSCNQEMPFSLQFADFVDETELFAESFDRDDWKKASKTIDSLKHEYAIRYNKLSNEELDMVDDAIDRYNMVYRQYREIPFEEDTTRIMIDGIEFNFENPTSKDLAQWKQDYSRTCERIVENMDKEDFSIPRSMIKDDPCLVYLVLKSRSLSSRKEKQSWFDLYSIMYNEQLNKLYDILYREMFKLGKLDKKHDIRAKASEFNSEAYGYAMDGDFFNAKMTIDKARMLMPDNANYYDSEGEFCTMQGRTERALSLWNKVMELDPDFLDTIAGNTSVLYEYLKEQGLVE